MENADGGDYEAALNRKRIAHVEKCFGRFGKSLAAPQRVLLGEGVLMKACRKKDKPRQFFLFSDMLVYGTIVVHGSKYTKQTILPAESLSVRPLADGPGVKNAWQICTPSKSFTVYSATEAEKTDWMAHINAVVGQAEKRSSVGSEAAVWVQDSRTTVCMLCYQTKFSALQRRHHCRHCGQIVCAACSQQRIVLGSISEKPVRVCTRCFKSLTEPPPPLSQRDSDGDVGREEPDRSAFADADNYDAPESAAASKDDDADADSDSDDGLAAAVNTVTLGTPDTGVVTEAHVAQQIAAGLRMTRFFNAADVERALREPGGPASSALLFGQEMAADLSQAAPAIPPAAEAGGRVATSSKGST